MESNPAHLLWTNTQESARSRSKKYYENNKNLVLQRQSKSVARKASRRSFKLRTKYNLTIEGWEKLFDEQGRVCACCGSSDPGTRGWCVDHDHTTGEIRGILCQGCNKGIGLLGDDLDGIQRAEEYLRRTK